MSQSKFCVITMQYGFVGMVSIADGFFNEATCHSRSRQFKLDLDANFSDQIFKELRKMTNEADIYHDKESPCSKGLGHILSHSVTIIDG